MSSPVGGVNTGQLRRLPRTWLLQNCTGADYAGKMFLPRELLIFSQENQWRKGGEEELIRFWIFLFPKMMSFQLTSVINASLGYPAPRFLFLFYFARIV